MDKRMSNLPYITAPGNIEKALAGIKSAATPERVSQDFVKTILGILGGSGNQVTSYLKKIGFANADGTPSEIYKRFRNPATAGRAAADALKIGYAALYKRNEYMHQLPDEKLKGLIIEETGQSSDSSTVTMIMSGIKALKRHADFTKQDEVEASGSPNNSVVQQLPTASLPNPPSGSEESVGLNLSYTINLNLPATSDIAVFNAIFQSLRENLLKCGGSSVS
jgi:hypothetical protein